MDIKEQIKKKIYDFIIENKITPQYESCAPIIYQQFFLSNYFDERMVDFFVLCLAENKADLIDFLGEELFYSEDFMLYYNDLTKK